MQTVIEIIAEVVLVLSSLFLILTILMHKGSGGGLSDMFGGGLSSSAGSSGVAMRKPEPDNCRYRSCLVNQRNCFGLITSYVCVAPSSGHGLTDSTSHDAR